MFNRYTAAVYAIAILSLVVASVFAIGVVPQQASAQISGNGSGNSNRTGSNSTSNGAAAGGSTTGMSGSGYGY